MGEWVNGRKGIDPVLALNKCPTTNAWENAKLLSCAYQPVMVIPSPTRGGCPFLAQDRPQTC